MWVDKGVGGNTLPNTCGNACVQMGIHAIGGNVSREECIKGFGAICECTDLDRGVSGEGFGGNTY